jgi:hypothetical protein
MDIKPNSAFSKLYNPMSKILFVTCFLSWTVCLLGQSKADKITNLGDSRIETYFYHKTNYDSLRLTIKGQADTVLTEEFWRNGHFSKKTWQNDSLYKFNSQGLIERKVFHLQKLDSIINFYANGQVESIISLIDKIKINEREIDFEKDGRIKTQ